MDTLGCSKSNFNTSFQLFFTFIQYLVLLRYLNLWFKQPAHGFFPFRLTLDNVWQYGWIYTTAWYVTTKGVKIQSNKKQTKKHPHTLFNIALWFATQISDTATQFSVI